MFIENRRLKQDNSILRGSLDQLKETLKQAETLKQETAYKHSQYILKMRHLQDQVSDMRNEFMMLNTFASELNFNIKSNRAFDEVMNKVRQVQSKAQNDSDLSAHVVLEKNKQIGDLFMKLQ